MPNYTLLTDVALAMLGSTRQNASRSARWVRVLGTAEYRAVLEKG
jgi:hypothetical protein